MFFFRFLLLLFKYMYKYKYTNIFINNLYDLIYGIEKDREDNELKRLLYVAMTRAKQNLHLVGSIRFKDEIRPASNSFLSMLWDIYGHHFEKSKAIETIEIDGLISKIEDFVPKLLRLKL